MQEVWIDGKKITIIQHRSLDQGPTALCGYYALYNTLCLETQSLDCLGQRDLFDTYFQFMVSKLREKYPGRRLIDDLYYDEISFLSEEVKKANDELRHQVYVPLVDLSHLDNNDLNLDFNDELRKLQTGKLYTIINPSSNHWVSVVITKTNGQLTQVDIADSTNADWLNFEIGSRIIDLVAKLIKIDQGTSIFDVYRRADPESTAAYDAEEARIFRIL